MGKMAHLIIHILASQLVHLVIHGIVFDSFWRGMKHLIFHFFIVYIK